MTTRLYKPSTTNNKSNIKLWGQTPNKFFVHLQKYYDTKTYNNKLKKLQKIKPYNELIKSFIEIDNNNNKELEEQEYINFAKKIFTGDTKNTFIAILNFAAGNNKKINIYEWLIINYFFEIKNYTYFTVTELSNNNNKVNYKNFVESVMNNTDIKNYINKKYKEELDKQHKIQQAKQTQSLQKIQIQQAKQPQQTQQTKLPQQIQKKIALVKIFNENLTNFKQDYKTIKDLIKINTFSSNPFINVLFENVSKLNTKFNEIIKKQNNNNCKKIINTIKSDLKEDNPNTINIKIFILLCYYINQLNCILNKFDDKLKEDYKSTKRFNTNNNNINSLKIELQKIINNSNDEINIEQICTNVNNILDIILKIFIGIHSDLSNFNNQPEYLFLDLNNN